MKQVTASLKELEGKSPATHRKRERDKGIGLGRGGKNGHRRIKLMEGGGQ